MQQIDFYFAFAYNYRNGRISTCKNSSCVTYFFHFVLFIYLSEDSSVHHLIGVDNACGIRSPEHVEGSSISSIELAIGKEMPMFYSKS